MSAAPDMMEEVSPMVEGLSDMTEGLVEGISETTTDKKDRVGEVKQLLGNLSDGWEAMKPEGSSNRSWLAFLFVPVVYLARAYEP